MVFSIGYVWYSYYSSAPATEEATEPAVNLDVQNIEARLAELRRLSDIQLDAALFREEAFKVLQFPVIPKPPVVELGRVNPFLPF